jgi:hypothetical protein
MKKPSSPDKYNPDLKDLCSYRPKKATSIPAIDIEITNKVRHKPVGKQK